ncbi:MAG: DUF3500 domain-containing protein [Planctomycetia bacterium]|nr:DUF3500 domain-containing protein [Planctomycetia bacterium]
MSSRKPFFALAVFVLAVAAGALLKEPSPGESMTQAAQKFIAALTAQQKAVAVLSQDDPKRLGWHFIPKSERKGLQLREMTEQQRTLARDLLAASLSKAGFEKAGTITDLEKILEKLEGEKARFKRDYLRYYFTIFGDPRPDSRWALSIEGHHLSLNFVVDGGRVVAHTPAFFGANPALVMDNYGVGPKKDTRALAKEELLAFDLLKSLNADQRKSALIAEKAPADIRGPADAQPPAGSPEGLPASRMTDDQKSTLKTIIEVYAQNMPEETASARLAEIEKAGIDKIHFAWAGADKPGVGHYYRIQGPTFLVEFVNVQPDGAGNPANHIHSVWRNIAGDFGLPAKK